ncbi:hypothetical protein B0E47_06260 [Rhodanobacter sp. B05]|uniref:DUF4365 domain-containing protein n=1 Tax=Rhodanobacter sp. B05 TaxID=1945859 RepID=UPI0009874378|nr:DUF4365 domain-containing protein [Rhodanobacter sp. B05]OOG57814.1 hypothetical protein B0E47_06260 [Rhodanobacter sp. B05]
MPAYKRSAITAKEGINFIRSAVEANGCLFIKIEQESDLGIDALIEFIENERPLNKQIAVQLKSGMSYFTMESSECAFPIGSHREYWAKHPLPVFGLVYVPTLQRAHWVDIKRYLKSNPNAASVRFSATEANRLDGGTFKTLFVRVVLGQPPVLEIDEGFRLARSDKVDEAYLGLLVLFRRFPNNLAVWEELVRTFIERPASQIPPVLIYWIAHIPWHDDIFSVGEPLSPPTRQYAQGLLSELTIEHVIKLLSFIEPEEQIGRGTLGQSVEAIISSLPKAATMLREVVGSRKIDMQLREYAGLILAMNEGPNALSELSMLEREGSWYAGEIAKHIKDYGGINPYA